MNFQKKDPAAADALRTLKGTLDMDNVPHLSGYDRERVCVPQFCDCDHQDCRYKRFLKRCDADRYVFQICNHNLLLADAIHRSQGKRPIFPEHSVIIVDEAHKLPEAAREMFGMTLTASDIQSMINQLRAERYLLAADVLTDTMGSLLRKLTQPREETEPLDAYLRLLTIPSRSLLVIEKQVGRLLSAQGRRQLEKLRGTVSLLSTVRLLKANGIGVYFEKENINTLTESSEFLVTLFSGFAQAESESLSKNVAWGKEKSAKAGNVHFQYKKMLGYRKGEDGQPEIVPEEAAIVRRIYRRYLDGCTLGKIKRELDEDGVPTAQGVECWSPAIIHNILTNEKYIGDALLQKTYVTDCLSKKVRKNRGERVMYYVENNHPAIISREAFDLVRKEMTRRSSKRKVLQKSGKTELGKYSGKYALTELLVCGECGSPYKRVTWARDGKKRIVWRCVSRLEFGTKYCHASPTLDEGKLHSAILNAMNEYAAIRQEVCPDVLAMVEEAKQALTQTGTKLLTLKRRLDEVSHEQADMLDMLLSNMADADLNARMKALTDEKASLKEQILETQQEEVGLEEQVAKRQQMWDSLIECSEGYTEFDDEFIRQIIQKITVEDADTIRIQFRDSDVVLEQGLQ